jgi:hypothetical protein
MKKRLFGLSKTAAAVQVLGLGLLLLISCNNIFVPPREEQAAGGGKTGTVLLTFGNGVEGARTLLPSSASFQLYKLISTPVEPAGAPVYQDISSDTVIALAVGTWNIHVDAYTDLVGNNKAAEGDSETFTVSANSTTPVTITLHAVTSGGSGTLSVDIDGEGGVINYGWLSISSGPDFNQQVTFNNGSGDSSDAYIAPSGLDLDISLPAGQYRVTAYIYNNENQRAYINEVAYIYSNLTTDLVELIKAGDFVDITTISGTVQYQENSVDQGGYTLEVYTNPDGTGNVLGYTYISSSGVQPYTLHVPRPNKDVTLYFHINKNGRSYASNLPLNTGQPAATKDIFLNRSIITLSGSVLLTLDGNPLTNLFVTAYPEGGSYAYDATVSNGSWTMVIPSDFSGILRFNIGASDSSGQWYYAEDVGSWTAGSSTTGINLSAALVSVSGSFVATENGNPIRGEYVNISAYVEGTSSPGVPEPPVFPLQGQSSHNWIGTTCNWTYVTAAFSPTVQAQFRITIGNNNLTTATETITLGTSSVTIAPATYTFSSTTLSGSVSLTVNGNPLTNLSISAYPEEGGYAYNATVSNGSWTMGIPSDFSGTLRFDISASDSSGQWYHASDVGSWTSGSSTTGINLSAALISLNGTIGTVTVNGNILQTVQVYARSLGESYWGSITTSAGWQITLPSDYTGTLTIGVEVEYDGNWYQQDIDTWTAGSSATTGISLGNVNITLSPMAGTVTTDGTIPLGMGALYVINYDPALGFNQKSLGGAEIIGGSFSGYSSVISGHVAIMDKDGNIYITASPITIGSSMNFNLSTMTSMANDL